MILQGGVVTPHGTVYFENGVLILSKQKKPKKRKGSHTMKQSQCSKSADFMLIKEAAGIRDG